MPNQVKVFDEIEFRGGAKHAGNIGAFQPKDVIFFTDFTELTLDATYWTETSAGVAAATAINAAVGGHARMTTGTTDNASMFLATPIVWEDDKNAKAEVRIRLNDVSGVALFFGFSDATSETTPEMPIDYADGTLAKGANTTNAVGFVVDADKSSSSIFCAGCAAGALDDVVDSGTDWADEVWHVLRVELTPDGYANFWLDGTAVGFIDVAVTSGTDLCVMIAAANRDGNTDTIDIDYVWASQDR